MKVLPPVRVVNIRSDDYDVYVGRAGHGEDGWLGNPHLLSSQEPRGATIERYRETFYGWLTNDAFKKRVDALAARSTVTLGCFCAKLGGITAADKPFTCHGQVIAEYLDEVRARRANGH